MPALVLAQTTRLRGISGESGGGGMNDGQPAPIDEGAEDASIDQIRNDGRHPLSIEIFELGVGHFAGSHHEFPTFAPADVTADCDIERLVGQNHARGIGPHEPFDDGGIGGVPAEEAMGAEQEQIAGLSHGRMHPVQVQAHPIKNGLGLPITIWSISSEPNPEISIGASAMMSSLNSASSSPMSQTPFSARRLTAKRSKRCSVSVR